MKSKYKDIFSFVFFTILPLVSSSLLTYFVFKNQEFMGGLETPQWIIVSVFFAVASALAVIPPTFLAIVMGFFMGWYAFPFLVGINMLAISLIFGVYKLLKFSWIEKTLRENRKIQGILEKIKKEELKIIFFTKLSPLFPFAVTNLIFAVSGARFRNILLGGFLGMIPRTLLAVYVGSEAKGLQELVGNPNDGMLSKVVISGLILVSTFGMYLVLKKSLNK